MNQYLYIRAEVVLENGAVAGPGSIRFRTIPIQAYDEKSAYNLGAQTLGPVPAECVANDKVVQIQ